VNFGLPLRGLGFFAFIAIISEHSSCTPLHPPQRMRISPRSRPHAEVARLVGPRQLIYASQKKVTVSIMIAAYFFAEPGL